MSKLEKEVKNVLRKKRPYYLAGDKDENTLAAIAGMGKIGKDDSFNAMVPDMLTDSDPKVRAAAEGLKKMKNEHASAHLRYYLEREKIPSSRLFERAISSLNGTD